MTATTETPTSRHFGFGHIAALDGLRGAAVAAVLLYHGGSLDGGYLGVDLFFVLSGFLITSLLLAEEASTGSIALKRFWGRRVRRLLPALLLLILGVAAYAHVIARPVDLGSIRADGLATLAYVANWRTILHGTSYWDLALTPSPLQHAWSLAIEEQFYLVWPFVVFAIGRRKPKDLDRTIFWVASVGAAVSASWFVALHALGASDTRVYEGTDTRAAALLGGVALAAWIRLRRQRGAAVPPATPLVASVATLALAAMWLALPGTSVWLYRGLLPVASALAVVVVGAIALGRPGPVGRVLVTSPLRGLGAISYGLYLWHWPVYLVIDSRNGRFPGFGDLRLEGLGLLGVKLAVSLVFALASYWLVEQPIRRGALQGKVAVFSALAGIAVAAAALLITTSGAIDPQGSASTFGQPADRIPGAPSILMVGDSVSLTLATNLAADPARYGVNPINRAFPGCSEIAQGREVRSYLGDAIEPEPCFATMDEELTEIDPDVIFLLIGSRPNDEVKIDGAWVGACDPAFDDAYRESMVDFVDDLGATGRPIVIGTITYSSENAFMDVPGADERIDCVNREIRAVVDEVPNTALVDLNELVCPDGDCIEQWDGQDLRPDGLHFGDNPAGLRVTDWVVEQILDRAGLTAVKD